MPAKKEKPVLICTTHRGVFFGYTDDPTKKSVTLKNVRCCLYWPASQKGFIGLASDGPLEGARVSKKADGIFHDVTCALDCTPEAVARWEAAPWK